MNDELEDLKNKAIFVIEVLREEERRFPTPRDKSEATVRDLIEIAYDVAKKGYIK